jgi:large subunit ribosomal protein L2
VPATVERLEYDPNRTAFIALIKLPDGELAYILAPQRLPSATRSWRASRSTSSRATRCRWQHPGRHDRPQCRDEAGKGGQIARSAGTYAQLVGRDQGYAILRLNSGEQRLVRGELHGDDRRGVEPGQLNISIGKAGRKRWMGKRPHGARRAMNPVDHPHGGGEGRTSGGRHPVTPWGKPTKGKKTRKQQATDKFIMRSQPPRAQEEVRAR